MVFMIQRLPFGGRHLGMGPRTREAADVTTPVVNFGQTKNTKVFRKRKFHTAIANQAFHTSRFLR